MLQQFKLNHGLLLDGYKMEPSKQAVFGEDGEFNMSTFIHVDSSNEFDEYGHFYPLSIVFGKSLKNILPNSPFSITPEKVDLTLESLKSRFNNLNLQCLSTQRGNFVEEDGLSDWFQNTNNGLEIIE